MSRRLVGKVAGGAAILIAVSAGLASAPSAHAEDFFSALFGGFRMRPPPEIRMPLPNDDGPRYDTPRRASYGGGTAYCVRGCDGRGGIAREALLSQGDAVFGDDGLRGVLEIGRAHV